MRNELLVMDEIKQQAQLLFEIEFNLKKPFIFNEELTMLNNKYWDIHGKNIAKKSLIEQLRDLIQNLNLEIILNPPNAYLLEPKVLEAKKLIKEIELI